ncbi:hypothetical protein O181_095118 [Austropuccinia psidii MF-1]|uniref:Uncharacterized protein n=1 Tax=Austropuccinia psidii MF-1 TaxID=1389203 RepID=A0A9Q3J4G1_9BASI|nr:hypothetical protein [Austropuccinia psidii MF-1]
MLEYLDQTSSPIIKSRIHYNFDSSQINIPDIISSNMAIKIDSPEKLKPQSPVYCSPSQIFSLLLFPLSPVFSLYSDLKFSASGERIIKIEGLDPFPSNTPLPIVPSTSKQKFKYYPPY